MRAGHLVPLILLVVLVGILAAVGYVVYTVVQGVSKTTREKMERKHVMLTKDGMKVEMKEMRDEEYKDRSQSVLVNMWNHTSFPNYKSHLWDMTGEEHQKGAEKHAAVKNDAAKHSSAKHAAEKNGVEKRKPHS